MRGFAGRVVAALAATSTLLGATGAWAQDLLPFEPAEIRRILRHGPWPQSVARDPSNRVSGHPAAIALGQRLFFDARLSANGSIACATCHVPGRGWTDGRPQAVGLAPVDRNTPTVLNVGLQRWFSWDGRTDSLWSQSMKPIVDPREMGLSARQAAGVVGGDRMLSCLYESAFGERPGIGASGDDERVFVNLGKALAAFLEGVRSGRTAFDEFRDALARGDLTVAAGLAPRGLRSLTAADIA